MMPDVSGPACPRRRLWIVPAALALAVGLAASAPAVRTADAKPEFSRREGKDCTFCHVNPRGGGARNAKGMEYEKNGFKFPGATQGFGEDDAFTSQANGQLYYLVKVAISIEHHPYAYDKLKLLQGKERKGPGAQKVMNTWSVIDGKGRDLARKAKDAIQNGQVRDAADALIRLETEFKGRDPAKEVARIRADLEKLPGGKEAQVAARTTQTQRLAWFAAQMREEEGDAAGALKALSDFAAKWPDSVFLPDVKKRIEELTKPPPTVAEK